MGNVAFRYFETDSWKIIEKGFHKDRNRVSESVFSIANEYMGVRGYIDEGADAESLQGSYFNGIYENAKKENDIHYKGIIRRTHFMVNSVNWLKTSIEAEGEKLDIAKSDISDFIRELDMRTGVLLRSFVWKLKSGKKISVTFERFVSMGECERGWQRITLRSDSDAEAHLDMALDFNVLHWGKDCYWTYDGGKTEDGFIVLSGKTLTTNQRVISGMFIDIDAGNKKEFYESGLTSGVNMTVQLKKGVSVSIIRGVTNLADKTGQYSDGKGVMECHEMLKEQKKSGYFKDYSDNASYWKDFWNRTDIATKQHIGKSVSHMEKLRCNP
jgi:maltose phosphorylase